MGRAEELTAPAGHTILAILDHSLPGFTVHPKHVLGADRKTDPAAGAAFYVQDINSHLHLLDVLS
jgi:hypothetical protein